MSTATKTIQESSTSGEQYPHPGTDVTPKCTPGTDWFSPERFWGVVDSMAARRGTTYEALCFKAGSKILPRGRYLRRSERDAVLAIFGGTITEAEVAELRPVMAGPSEAYDFTLAMMTDSAAALGIRPTGRLLDIINVVACGAARMQIAQVADLPFIERTGNAKNPTDQMQVLGVLAKSLRHAVLRTPVGEPKAFTNREDNVYASEVEGGFPVDPSDPRERAIGGGK